MNWNKSLVRFERYLSSERRLASNTVNAYIADITKLSVLMPHKEPTKIDTAEIKEFMTTQGENGCKANSQARTLASIKSFFEFLENSNLIEKNPAALVRAPKIVKKMPTILSVEEVNEFLDSVDTLTKQGLRNRTMLELLYGAGLRVSELLSLSTQNIFTETSKENKKHSYLKVTGKGSKTRLVPLPQEIMDYVESYLEARPTYKIVDKDILFLNRSGKKLTTPSIDNLIKKICTNLGWSKIVSPHTFRHSYATHLIKAGANIKALQDILGHASISTTEKYIHLDTTYLSDTISSFHPKSIRK